MRNRIILYPLLMIFGIFNQGLIGQQNQFLASGDSDPDAIRLLDDVLDRFAEYDLYEMRFALEYKDKQNDPVQLKGNIVIQGDKYRFELDDQLIISDGNYVWQYLKSRNEAYIQDLEPDNQSMLSPTYFLAFHRNKDYVCGITNAYQNKKGEKMNRIDFKGLSQFAEFTKIGIDINAVMMVPEKILVLNKDGSRILIDDILLSSPGKTDPGTFIFNASQYPDLKIEDLRLD